ncbi:MAG TPA: formate dehydrogenase accessory sulfurtransferase FdhD [Anaeromyxobacteraceae bacterium]|nr:formate dehydrogenase accessory sulfurtransferase FdhD [Anaeromyxobacteraceae bacterium]
MDPQNAVVARGVAQRPITRLEREEVTVRLDTLVVEEPLEIRVDGETVATTMRTPGQDGELALGFLFAEGIIEGAADVGSVAHCGRHGEEGYGNVIDVHSAGGHRIDPERVLEGRRWAPPTSACGVCGRRTIEDLLSRARPVDPELRVPRSLLTAAQEALRSRQPIFARTGGLHAAAILDTTGAVLAAAEDVGRHNAVDKAVGQLVRSGLLGRAQGQPAEAAPERAGGLGGRGASPQHDVRGGGEPRPAVLAVSGRAGFEIVQKAAAAGVPVVASVSAPSSLAAELADRASIALAGFVRGEACNVYTHAWRLGIS